MYSKGLVCHGVWEDRDDWEVTFPSVSLSIFALSCISSAVVTELTSPNPPRGAKVSSRLARNMGHLGNEL